MVVANPPESAVLGLLGSLDQAAARGVVWEQGVSSGGKPVLRSEETL